MKKILLATILGTLIFGCAAPEPEPEEAFHSTDALLIGGNGGFNPDGTDGGADFGNLYDEEIPEK